MIQYAYLVKNADERARHLRCVSEDDFFSSAFLCQARIHEQDELGD